MYHFLTWFLAHARKITYQCSKVKAELGAYTKLYVPSALISVTLVPDIMEDQNPRAQGQCGIQVLIVCLFQVSPGSRLSTTLNGKEVQVGELGTDYPSCDSNSLTDSQLGMITTMPQRYMLNAVLNKKHFREKKVNEEPRGPEIAYYSNVLQTKHDKTQMRSIVSSQT